MNKDGLRQKKVFLYWNGFSYQIFHPIANSLLKFGFKVYTIENPFTKLDRKYRLHSEFNGNKTHTLIRKKKSLVGTPIGHLFDIFWPMNSLKADVAICFSPHLTLRNIILKRLGLVKVVVQWNIDYSPIRFSNPLLQKMYVLIDKIGVKYSDYQIDLTKIAQQSRLFSHEIEHSGKNLIVPVGTDFKKLPDFNSRPNFNLVFVGNFNETQDVEILLKCMILPRLEKLNVELHVVGSGSSFELLKSKYDRMNIFFHGNLGQNQIDLILSKCHVGLAPYIENPKSFSRFSDPSKLKKYSEFGLPIIMTDVTHNAKYLEKLGVALVGKCEVDFFASSIENLYGNKSQLEAMSKKSKDFCLLNSWDQNLKPLFNVLKNLN
jgi:glycosyltransferase involved in cell wall biosynthesis